MKRDDLFQAPEEGRLSSFAFDQRVVDVFDDMVSRSVPGYATIQLLVADLAIQFAKQDWIVDVGCSTGNTILSIQKRSKWSSKIVGIDQSIEMVTQCRENVTNVNRSCLVEIIHHDILDGAPPINNKAPRVIILNLVLMFIRPIERIKVLRLLHNIILPGGCLILVEKTVETIDDFNRVFIDYYHNYKIEMGYSEIEVSRKREALENRLIPFTREENNKILAEAGFNKVTTFFQWMNFCGSIALKLDDSQK